jgi:hypothetical protein
MKYCHGFSGFFLRGLQKVKGEFRLWCSVHNLLKLYTSNQPKKTGETYIFWPYFEHLLISHARNDPKLKMTGKFTLLPKLIYRTASWQRPPVIRFAVK